MINVTALDVGEEDIIHYGGIRVRVNGNGLLRPTFYSLDNSYSYVLVPLQMANLTPIEPVRLANFNQQRVFLKLETTGLDEVFKINRIIVFARPIYTGHPG